MSLFGNDENKCILCRKNIGRYYHAAADGRFLCDRCAEECGYENDFFKLNPAEILTKAKIERDWGFHEQRMEENKQLFKNLKTNERFERMLYLDSVQLRFYSPTAVICGSKTPVVYSYNQVKSCSIVLFEDDRRIVLKSTDGISFNLENKSGFNLPVVDQLQVEIETDNPYCSSLTLPLLDEAVRKSSKTFEKAVELAEEMYSAFANIVRNNRK